jgi:hypothetical protein
MFIYITDRKPETIPVYICTDINPHASQVTRRTGRQNQVELDVVNGAFALPLHQRLRSKADVIVFNPPYVPTPYEEAQMAQNEKDIGGAWAGGKDGMEVTNNFLDQVGEILSHTGRFYLVALKQNNVPEIRERMLREQSLQSQVRRKTISHERKIFIIGRSCWKDVQEENTCTSLDSLDRQYKKCIERRVSIRQTPDSLASASERLATNSSTRTKRPRDPFARAMFSVKRAGANVIEWI